MFGSPPGILRWRLCRMYVVCICNTIRRLESQHAVILHFMTTRVPGAKPFFSRTKTDNNLPTY